MKTSNNLFLGKFKSRLDHKSINTSHLLEDGLFLTFQEPGIPFYMPVGKKIVDKIESLCTSEAENLDIPLLDFPLITKNELLEKGEPMEEKFRKKVFYIEGEMEGYHVFTTPEPVIIELASKSLESHKQLPIRQVYHTEVFRAINHPEGILKSRQFKTFMGHSLDAGPDSAQKSLGKFEELTDKILNELKIKTKKIVKPTGFNLEYFYLCNEGDNLELGDDGEKTKSLSLAMAYHYAPNLKTWARFRDNTNKNSRVKYVTYGFGTQRALYSILDSNRDELGFNIPEVVRPFNLSIIPMNRGLTEKTQKLYDSFLEIKKRDILFDDRENLDWGEKAKFADYLGIPIKIIISPQEAILKSRGGIEIARFENLQSIESFIKSYK